MTEQLGQKIWETSYILWVLFYFADTYYFQKKRWEKYKDKFAKDLIKKMKEEEVVILLHPDKVSPKIGSEATQ